MPTITDKFSGDISTPTRGQVIYRDDSLSGFGLRVTPKSKSYIAKCKVNGLSRRVTIGRLGIISADDARSQAERLIGQMTAKRLPSKRSIKAPTLRELLAFYLDRKQLRPATVATYSSAINYCLQDWLDKPITAITEEMVQSRHRDLVRPNHMGTTGEFRANAAMHVLSRLLNYAADNLTGADGRQIIETNPVRKLNQNKLWHKTNRRELVVADHKLADWYQALMSLDNVQIQDYLLLLILTGLRRTEAIRLRWSDIDFEEQTLTIPAEVSKNHREHRLPLSDFLLIMLESRRSQSGKSGRVFPRDYADEPMAYPYDAIRFVAQRAGCEFTPHALRRSFCSVAARAGVGHHLIRKLVNHTQVLDVAHKYILIGVEGLREPMQQITDRFISLMGCSPTDRRIQLNRPNVARRGFKSPTLDELLDAYVRSKSLRPGAVKYYEKAIWTGLRDWVHLPGSPLKLSTAKFVTRKQSGQTKKDVVNR